MLAGFVAGDANHSRAGRRREQLYHIAEALENALAARACAQARERRSHRVVARQPARSAATHAAVKPILACSAPAIRRRGTSTAKCSFLRSMLRSKKR